MRPRSSPGTTTASTSMTVRSAWITDEWVSSVTHTDHRAGTAGRV